MPDVSLSVSTLAEINLFVLTATIAVGLVAVRPASRPTRWLAAAIAVLAGGIAANVLLSPLSVITEGFGVGWVPSFVVPATMLAFHSVALVGFAYSHSGDARPREARLVLAGLFGLFSACLGAAVFGALMMGRQPDRDVWTWVGAVPSIALLLFPVLVCLWAAVVELRNGVRLVRSVRPALGRAAATWQSLVSPPSREARAHRGFALFMTLGAFMALYWAANPTAAALDLGPLDLAAIAYVVVLAALFLSYAPDPVPLRTRLTVLVLGAALALLTAVPYLAVDEADILAGDGIAPPREAVLFTPMAGGGYRTERSDTGPSSDLGEAVALSSGLEDVQDESPVPLGFDFPFGGEPYDEVRFTPFGTLVFGEEDDRALPPGAPAIAPLAGWFVPWEGGGLYVHRSPGRAVFTWEDLSTASLFEVDVEGWPTTTTMQVSLDSSGAVTMSYGAVGAVSRRGGREITEGGVRGLFPNGVPTGPAAADIEVPPDEPVPEIVPEDGFVQNYGRAYEAEATRRLFPFLWLSLAAAALVLAGVPLVLRLSVTRPLDRLLDGVRRVRDGDLTTTVDVEARDEVGRLADGFNVMTASLREANAALRTHADELEGRVADRTAALASANSELAQKNGELERTLEELSRTQAQLLLQEKQASLGRLTSGIAHELKNPLNFVNNFAGLSREMVGELRSEIDAALGRPATDADGDLIPLLADLAENAGRIAEHGRRADAIVRAMMDHAGGTGSAVAPVEIGPLVGRAAEEAQKKWEAERGPFEGAIVVEVADAGEVEADAEALVRAVGAVVENALDAVAERAGSAGAGPGTLGVSVRVERRGDVVVVAVEDDGHGLADGASDRAFEPFYTTRPTGTGRAGLGLSLAHDVVVGHGGAIEITAKDGGGTRVGLTLPAVLHSREPGEGPEGEAVLGV